ncbi:MAG: hypothetical protein J6X28_01965 [Bacilli bacterium]|nr:hypothetical protein [Bacilli bacterium]
MNTEEYNRLLRKYQDLKLAGDILLGIGGTGFIGSVLSPFDFEGPVIEILTGIIAIIGIILKKVGENKLADLHGVETTGFKADDKKQLEDIQKNIVETTKQRRERKQNKK